MIYFILYFCVWVFVVLCIVIVYSCLAILCIKYNYKINIVMFVMFVIKQNTKVFIKKTKICSRLQKLSVFLPLIAGIVWLLLYV